MVRSGNNKLLVGSVACVRFVWGAGRVDIGGVFDIGVHRCVFVLALRASKDALWQKHISDVGPKRGRAAA